MSDDQIERIPNVQRIVKPNGRVHLYFRAGSYREALESPEGSQALQDEVAAIRQRLAKAAAAQKRPRPGTVGGAIRAYTGEVADGVRSAASADFLVLASSTQQAYHDLADELFADVGSIPLAEVSRSWLLELRDAWAVRGHRAANMRMQVLKNALIPIVDDETDKRIEGDPFHRLKKVRRPHGAGESHPIWEDAEVAAAIEDAIVTAPGLARAYALARYAGFRRGTICNFPLNARTVRQNDDGDAERRLLWLTEKREVLCDKREDDRLTDILTRTRSKALTVAYNADGHAYREYTLNQAVGRHLDRLAREGKVRGALNDDGVIECPLTLHGLRHTRGVELAMAGASDAEIMAQLEHRTDRAAKEYRRQAQRRRLADQGQDRIDNVVKLRAAKKARTASAEK